MFNFWGTNLTPWGGLLTPGTRGSRLLHQGHEREWGRRHRAEFGSYMRKNSGLADGHVKTDARGLTKSRFHVLLFDVKRMRISHWPSETCAAYVETMIVPKQSVKELKALP
jgi:hypothetical protein